MDFGEAVSICDSKGGHLLELESDAEYDQIVDEFDGGLLKY